MRLDEQQVRQFETEGWLFLPAAFSAEEVAVLRTEAEAIFREDRQEIWRETTGSPRTAFAAHTYNEGFRILGAHPRLIEPVEQLFGDRLYMHQFKINAKSAFDGAVWQWHQDYGTWARDDGMPEANAMNIAVFLDEVMAINGPLMLVPRSHRHGTLAAEHDVSTTSYPLWTLDNETVKRLVDEGGIVTPIGAPGGVMMFHGNLVHGSAGNITPVSSQDRVSHLECRCELYSHPDAAGLDRASGFRARSSRSETTRCCGTPDGSGRPRNSQGYVRMRAILASTILAVALAAGSVGPAQAKGCIKGAIVGGLAGHAVHHGVVGAVGGCAVGHHLASKSAHKTATPENTGAANATTGSHSTRSDVPSGSTDTTKTE